MGGAAGVDPRKALRHYGAAADCRQDPPRENPEPAVAKPLVIVESPAKASTIAGYLGDDYTVMASVGHIRDLPSNKAELEAAHPDKVETYGRLAGINPDDNFDVAYVVHASKKKVVTELKKALKNADELILATDEDREGEAIGWHVREVLDPKVPIKRMVFHEITPHAIREALDTPRELDMKLVEAQETRRVLDRIVGWETSPVLWRVWGQRQAASAGRVQSVALRMVVRARASPHAVPVGRVARPRRRVPRRERRGAAVRRRARRARRQADRGRPRLRCRDRARSPPVATSCCSTEARRLRLADRLRDAPFRVTSVESDPFTEKPKAPFTTSTLQQEAGRKLRFTASRTMAVAQRLYENGYITYMRTDSTNLSEQAITAARTAIRQQYGDDYLPDRRRARTRSKVKNAQEAHEAIRPAGDEIRSPDAVRGELDGDEQRLYELIWMRTIACQMVDARGRKMTIRLAATSTGGEQAIFRASGKTYDFLGWRRAYIEDVDEGAEEEREARLPSVTEGDALTCRELTAVGTRDEAARSLHRSELGQGARRARHRASVDLRGGDRNDPGARLRVAQGDRARSRVDRVRGHEPARTTLRAPRRLQLHGDDGRSARRHRERRGRSARSGSTRSTSATARPGSASSRPTSTSRASTPAA